MKNRIGLFLCLVLAITAAGCGKDSSDDRIGSKPAGVSDVLEAGIDEKENEKETVVQETVQETTQETRPVSDADTNGKNTKGIDVDLTALSSTMVYSEVFNMINSPENFMGKTVKMNGVFALYHDEATDNNYYACIIADATACCSQGIEFVLTDDYTYPDDYPEIGGDISVEGVFDTYQEGDYTYCTLRDAKIV